MMAGEEIDEIIEGAQPKTTVRQTRCGVSVMKGKKQTKLSFTMNCH